MKRSVRFFSVSDQSPSENDKAGKYQYSAFPKTRVGFLWTPKGLFHKTAKDHAQA